MYKKTVTVHGSTFRRFNNYLAKIHESRALRGVGPTLRPGRPTGWKRSRRPGQAWTLNVEPWTVTKGHCSTGKKGRGKVPDGPQGGEPWGGYSYGCI